MYKYRRVIVSLIAGVLVFSILIGIIAMLANAKTSDEISAEIDELQAQSDEIGEQLEQLQEDIASNQNRTISIVEQKFQVDREIELTRQSVENVTEQIRQYSLLISEKQAELDELEQAQRELQHRYQQRMRVLQERGEPSFWDVVFESKSFADMLTNRMMIEEIAATDQRMKDELLANAKVIVDAKGELAQEKTNLELKKQELAEAEERLAEKREESDALLAELLADRQRLIEETERYEQAELELSNQIAALEVERTAALLAEWQAAHPPAPPEPAPGDDPDEPSPEPEPVDPPSTSEYFLFPLPTNVYIVLTSPYGFRVHPITGKYTMHNGVDFACAKGTPIYASKSGYVTIADNHYAWGNYVTINHMDGFSTLYGHMTYYDVSEGEYVERGQVIGYVGTTGYSTGNHLHFTIYYNGSTVNPMEYVSLP